MPDPHVRLRLPARSLARSLAAAGLGAGLLPAKAEAPPPENVPGGEAWADAVEALGGRDLVEAAARNLGPQEAKSATLEAAFRDPLPPPDPARRSPSHPAGPAPPAAVRRALRTPPDRALVLPARTGRLAGDLRAWGAGEVRAHEPDPHLRDRLEARAGADRGLVAEATPATELAYARDVDAAVAGRPLQATRSLVGLLGRLHHALDDGGTLVLVDVLRDEAQDPATPRNRRARALRVHLRARGRDLVARQDLWRLLVETGFQEVRFQPLPGGRYLVRARK